ncbi:MAG: putative gamma-glutamyltransferase YwrD [Alphaproteobacteria bacterium MarineAlpha10_Bin2]|nr:MAG: putative gamma-glutamyltransferase YwrD [Alphaproteobacteria bacterium MarineAlpha10_Bin2]HIM45257.1 gamma-glutamyltransferase [Alphaproteobacteria bacterium]
MRDFQLPGRSTAHGINGMAATSHPLATVTALEVLKAGGNAVDAAIAACAVLGVVEPQSTGIGGDCFALYAPKGRIPPIAINGSGRAPQAASVDSLRELGLNQIDYQSPHAVTVPGAVDAWSQLLADHGSKDFAELLQPAIRFAENGYAVSPRVAMDWAANAEKLAACPNAKRIFLAGGEAPVAGDVHRQPELANSLKAIARDGRDAFYQGAIGADIVAHLNSLGSLMTASDFADYGAQYVEPIKTNYRGYEVFECPPNGQGIIALIILNILQGYDLSVLDPNGWERLHLEAEATRLAYRDRAVLIADPDAVDVRCAHLLSPGYADSLRSLIAGDSAMASLPAAGESEHRDTVYLTVVDSERNAISFINSTFHAFGSGICAPKSGVMLQNRGSSFVLDDGHANRIEPGKRPMHTIIPGMLAEGERAVMPFGVMGGHYQATGHAHFLTNFIDFAMDPQEALDAPRAFHYEDELTVENGVSPATRAKLSELGHPVEAAELPLGGGQAILIDWQRGSLTGASDPRKDGCALGY